MRKEEKVRYQLMAADDKRRYEQENQMMQALEKVPPVKSLAPPEDRKERSPPQLNPILEAPPVPSHSFHFDTTFNLAPQAQWPTSYDHFLASEAPPLHPEMWQGDNQDWHADNHQPVFHPEHMSFPAMMDASPWGFFGPQFTNPRGTVVEDHDMPSFHLRGGSNSQSH